MSADNALYERNLQSVRYHKHFNSDVFKTSLAIVLWELEAKQGYLLSPSVNLDKPESWGDDLIRRVAEEVEVQYLQLRRHEYKMSLNGTSEQLPNGVSSG